MAVRVRPDVWKLNEWDDVLVWYARAIREMQKRPIADPTSWRYQAAIHDYARAGDPLADPADQLPSTADQARFWKQCQHGSWYFLPWHRLYLGFFEQIVADNDQGDTARADIFLCSGIDHRVFGNVDRFRQNV